MQKKRLKPRLILMLVFIAGYIFTISAKDNTPNELMQKEYPELYSVYKAKLENQKAHYIFAIDISSSMGPFEQTVKKNCSEFIKALPDGDEVSLIQEASSEKTDFISFNNTVLNAKTRQQLANAVQALHFIETGSDGYKMTEKIIDAITQTGSSNLVYVFMFTDFEYWTKLNKFNKKAVNWEALNARLSPFKANDQRIILATGLRLSFKVNASAVYENELQTIFSGIRFIQVSDKESLNKWFSDAKANITAEKLKNVINKELESLTITPRLSINSQGINADLVYSIPDFKLYSAFDIKVNGLKGQIKDLYIPVNGTSIDADALLLAKPNNHNKPILPSWIKLKGLVAFTLIPETKYKNELDKLYINLNKSYSYNAELTPTSVFIHIFPWWVDIIILVLFILIVLCIYNSVRKRTLNMKLNIIHNGSHLIINKNISGVSTVLIGQIGTGTNGNAFTEIIAGTDWELKIYYRKSICFAKRRRGMFLHFGGKNKTMQILRGGQKYETYCIGSDYKVDTGIGLTIQIENTLITF